MEVRFGYNDTAVRLLVLCPAVSMISVGPQGHYDHSTRDPCALASAGRQSPGQVVTAEPNLEGISNPKHTAVDTDEEKGAAINSGNLER